MHNVDNGFLKAFRVGYKARRPDAVHRSQLLLVIVWFKSADTAVVCHRHARFLSRAFAETRLLGVPRLSLTQLFQDGNWENSKKMLEKCVVLRPSSRKPDGA